MASLAACALFPSCAVAAEATIPHYDHIFVIIEENHSADEIIGNAQAPNFNRLAKTYGYASNFYAERHPSEPNYVATLGGNSFGIADDDWFSCKPGVTGYGCDKAGRAGYVDHTLTAPGLTDQLNAHGLSWKGYFESIPAAGSTEWRWPRTDKPIAGQPASLYASKHNGFMNFKSVQDDPKRSERIVGFDVFDKDVAGNALPAYAQIVPNQCNDMHGLSGADVPADCTKANGKGLVARADAMVGSLTDKIMHSSAWTGAGNTAIVITFDENDDDRDDHHPAGCCGFGDKDNPGGGWIPTIVVTNHGPRGVTDATAYNHYSLLRTTEAAFGIKEYLGHAADIDKGVTVMAPLFAVTGAK